MKILVTGGAGFIGSHLCDRLVSLGHSVICYDNLSTGKIENIMHLMGKGGFTFAHGDVNNESLLDLYMPGIDIVFNQMAAKKSVCEKNPLMDCYVNAQGTLCLLLSMVKHGVNKIVHASTGSVYGEVDGMITEKTPQNPVSYYGVSKLAGEKYVAAFSDLHCIKYTILRYFHVYGPRQDYSKYGGVVSIFINKALYGDPLPVHGDGNQVRSFTYVDDVVDANIAAMDTQCEIYNCASGINVTVNDLACAVEKRISDNGREQHPPLLGDIVTFHIDNSKISEHLGIEFSDFDCGLNKTISYYGG